jgi:hypothetical protein
LQLRAIEINFLTISYCSIPAFLKSIKKDLRLLAEHMDFFKLKNGLKLMVEFPEIEYLLRKGGCKLLTSAVRVLPVMSGHSIDKVF